ncbi:MAG: hypothetical protein JXJ22_07545 [Bacteroidales bacterium]|nr:hypothetical protein [Bacteroidales bacterium]
MKNLKHVSFYSFFVTALLFTGCFYLSPDTIPAITANPVQEEVSGEEFPGNTAGPENSPETPVTVSLSAAEKAVLVRNPDSVSPLANIKKGILITEIMYNPNSPDSDWEWIEVFNRTEDEIDFLFLPILESGMILRIKRGIQTTDYADLYRLLVYRDWLVIQICCFYSLY